MSPFVRTFATEGSGPRVAVKDTIDVAGYPTMAGSQALRGAEPAARDAEVVALARRAGCRIVGKTTLHELAFGITGLNDWAGTPTNPHFPHLVPGGSSSGSAAAVGAGLADFALGTDTGGSIRVPAACCGVAGFKPTFGRVSRDGVMPARTSLDCVGPLAPSVGGLIAAMGIIDPTFVAQEAPDPLIGVVEVDADPAIGDAVLKAVSRSGLRHRKVKLDLLDAAFEAGLVVINAEAWQAVGHLVETGFVGDDVASRLKRAALTRAEDVDKANVVRRAFMAEVDSKLGDVSALLLPTLPAPPPTVAAARDDRSAVQMSKLVRPFNLSGHPAIAMPGQNCEAWPVSLQLVGVRGGDAALLDIGLRLERLLPSEKN